MCRIGTIGVIATLAALTAGSLAIFAQEAAKPAEPAAQEAAKPAAPEAAKPAAPAAVVSTAKPVDKATISFNKKAKDNGELKFIFTPAGGSPMEIRVTIAKDMDDKESAEAALKEFKVALGDEKYSLDLDSGTKVTIKGKKDVKFNVAISAMSVPGLTVEFK